MAILSKNGLEEWGTLVFPAFFRPFLCRDCTVAT